MQRAGAISQGVATGEPRFVGRYAMFGEIAAGGMATVHFGKLVGAVGFSKTVAIKRLHPHLAHHPDFVKMFVDEARLAARIQHPNVVATLDIVQEGGETFLVLDYVHGESFAHLIKAMAARGHRMPPRVAASVVVNVLHGLHAAHEATDGQGAALGIVHRDVSPHNIMVGADGIARVLDFGVAKAAGRLQTTRDGALKGKVAYMPPEQIRGEAIDRRVDVYAAAAVMWGALVGRPLVRGSNDYEMFEKVVEGNFAAPSALVPGLSTQIDALVMRGLSRRPEDRYQTAQEMAIAVEAEVGIASPVEVARWVAEYGADALALRANRVRDMESRSNVRPARSGETSTFGPTPLALQATVAIPGPALDQAPFAGGHTLALVAGSRPNAGLSPQHLTPTPSPAYPAPAYLTPTPPPQHLTPTGPPAFQLPPPPPPVGLQPGPVSSSRSGKGKLILVAVAFFVPTLALVLFLFRDRLVRPTPTATATATATSTSTATSTPIATSTATSTPTAIATATASASAEASHTPKTSVKPPVPKPTAAKTAKPSCDNPFFVDAEGIKQVRPECM